ncbi:MAG: ComEC/Rec2 family competence protein [Opitutales bacterium]
MELNSAKAIRAHASLLYVFPGILAGLTLAKAFPTTQSWLIFLTFVTGAASYYISKRKPESLLWIMTFIGSSAGLFWFYGSLRLPQEPAASFRTLPERELSLELTVKKTFHSTVSKDSIKGIGFVTQAPDMRPDLLGKAIYFQLRENKDNKRSVPEGSTILARGILNPCPIPQKTDDFYSFLRQQNVFYCLERGQVIAARTNYADTIAMLAQLHRQFLKTLQLGIPNEAPAWAIYPAILLGYKAELSPELKSDFQRSGTLHLFAISGLHIGIVAAIIIQAFSLARIPSIYAGIIGLGCTLLFVLITGSPPSAVRAFAMIAFYWISLIIGRQRSALAAWTASALIILIIDPQQLWNIGFQLSYCVVFSILLLGLPLHKFLLHKLSPHQAIPVQSLTRWHRAKQILFEKCSLLFAVSLSAWISSAPLSLSLFGMLAVNSILVNLVLVNFAALVLLTGLLSIGFALIGCAFISEFINHAAWLVIEWMLDIIQLSTQLPASAQNTLTLAPILAYAALIIYGGSLVWLHHHPERSQSWRVCIPIFMMLTFLSANYWVQRF